VIAWRVLVSVDFRVLYLTHTFDREHLRAQGRRIVRASNLFTQRYSVPKECICDRSGRAPRTGRYPPSHNLHVLESISATGVTCFIFILVVRTPFELPLPTIRVRV
jgi:hypothetical protein